MPPVPPAESVPVVLLEAFRRAAMKAGDLPLLPAAAREVTALLALPDTPMDRVARVIAGDAGIATLVLKSANSAAFPGRSAQTIEAALTRLGSRGVGRVLYASAAGRLLVVRSNPDLTRRLQVRSAAVAAASGRIAGRLGLDPEVAFLAGLLHDIGWALGYAVAPEIARAFPGYLRDPAQVDALVEALHPDLGATAARNWNLPLPVVDAISGHHDPGGTPGVGAMAWVVAGGVRVADCAGIGPVEPPRPEEWEDHVLRRLRLGPREVDAMVEEVRREAG